MSPPGLPVSGEPARLKAQGEAVSPKRAGWVHRNGTKALKGPERQVIPSEALFPPPASRSRGGGPRMLGCVRGREGARPWIWSSFLSEERFGGDS